MNKKRENLILKLRKLKEESQMSLENSTNELFQMKSKFQGILEIGKLKKMILMQNSLIYKSKLGSRENQTYKNKLNNRKLFINSINNKTKSIMNNRKMNKKSL